MLVMPGCGQHAAAPFEQPGIAGYAHTLARSSFRTGTVYDTRDEFGMHKVIGENGVFAIDLNSLGAIALPNRPVPDGTGRDTFVGDERTHNAAVLSYFTRAGLPAEQVAVVSADQTGVTGPPFASNGILTTHSGVAWFTILHRAFEGVPIDDSTAWAILGLDGASLEEEVYWPSISGAVVKEMHDFQAMLANDDTRGAFLAKLPTTIADGELVIHHTGRSWQSAFDAVVCYRVTLIGATLHYGVTGELVRLPDEVSAQP